MIKQFIKFDRIFRLQQTTKPRILQCIVVIVAATFLLMRISATDNGISSPLSLICLVAAIIAVRTKSIVSDESLTLTYPLTTRKKVTFIYLSTVVYTIMVIIVFALLAWAIYFIFPSVRSDDSEFISAGNVIIYHSLTIGLSSFILFLSTIKDDTKSWLIALGGFIGYGLILSVASFIISNNFDFNGLIHSLPNNHYLTYIFSAVFVLSGYAWYELAIRILKYKK